MIIVGLTGGIGAGKSTVAQQLADLGAVVIDADALAREVVRPGTPGLAEVVEAFGPDILTPDGVLDRPALAEVVFGDRAQLDRLNAIVHPLVAQRTAQLVAAADPDAVVVHDVPLLVETGRSGYDLVVVVDAPDEVRVQRLVARGLPEDEARRRMAQQATREQRLSAADLVIDNGDGRDVLSQQVTELWRELVERLR